MHRWGRRIRSGDASKRHPFPCPTTYRTAFTHYVDILAPVKSHVLRAFAEYAADEEEKKYLLLLSTASEEGLVSRPRPHSARPRKSTPASC